MNSNNKKPKIFIISGPSGAGEDSVLESLAKTNQFNRVITTITRAMRPGESEGKPYYFTSVDQFKAMITAGELIEWALVYGDYRGCTKKEINRLFGLEKPILWKVDWQGVRTIKQLLPQTVAIFIAPPSIEALEKRLKARGQDSSKTIADRREFSQEWLKHQDVYDYIVTNEEDKLDRTIKEIADIISQELDA